MSVRNRIIVAGLALLVSGAAWSVSAQTAQSSAAPSAASPSAASPDETRVALTEQPVINDSMGAPALAGRLRETALVGSVEAPLKKLRLVVENRGSSFFTYASGWVTFYDAGGIRCGDGLFQVDALAPGELAEIDIPGLRLTCTAASWRLAAKSLLTRTAAADLAAPTAQPTTPAPPIPPLKISINGEVLPLQPGNPIEFKVGQETVRIVVLQSDK
ncbi:MAG: FxLYD domain-containing protein [Pyrinomonadaceae bacterium]